MAIVLGGNSYGKSETRVVRVLRDTPRHALLDRNVSTALCGDFAAAHVHGDQSRVLPTDTQKNTVYAFAKDLGDVSPEGLALALARHFVDDVGPVAGARVEVEDYAWDRVPVDGVPHEHTFVRRGTEVRTATVTAEAGGEHVVAGLTDLVVLKSTGSEFAGFLRDDYTTLAETHDRVMATSLTARWRYGVGRDVDWQAAYDDVRATLLARFAQVHSLALQQTLWEMGRAVLERRREIAEIRLVAPNKHHFVVDLSPFDRENRGEVFHADDRPYGLIRANVRRDEVPAAPEAWETWPPEDGPRDTRHGGGSSSR